MSIFQKLRAVLQLMRVANVFTAIADVLAGYLIAIGPRFDLNALPGLILCTSGIYAGGCVLNDLCDRELDARERPFRPLPSGRVTIREAGWLAGALFGIGLLGGLAAGRQALVVGIVLVILVLLYDCLTKGTALAGPLNMGACRAGNLLLGMSPALPFPGIAMVFPLLSLLYVFSLTVLSAFETVGRPGPGGWLAGAGLGLVLIAIAFLTAVGLLLPDGVLFLVFLAVAVASGLIRAWRLATPAAFGGAVKALVLGIPLLDAAYVAGVHGYPYGIPVLLCIVPAWLVSRYFYVT